ncbi:MAG: hypothetical protein E6559_21195, partial [Pantoea sp.]|nr:hypothetical protein [Pantoea sp.]
LTGKKNPRIRVGWCNKQGGLSLRMPLPGAARFRTYQYLWDCYPRTLRQDKTARKRNGIRGNETRYE